MKKESGKTALDMLITLVIAIIIGGVIVAMVYDKPKDTKNTENIVNTQNSDEEQNTVDTQENGIS